VPRSFPIAAPATPRTFDIAPDGKIVSVTQGSDQKAAIDAANGRYITVVLNWFEELKQRVRAR
jgi:hypothetical protein